MIHREKCTLDFQLGVHPGYTLYIQVPWDRTGQDRTGQDMTRQDRSAQDRTGQDRTFSI